MCFYIYIYITYCIGWMVRFYTMYTSIYLIGSPGLSGHSSLKVRSGKGPPAHPPVMKTMASVVAMALGKASRYEKMVRNSTDSTFEYHSELLGFSVLKCFEALNYRLS